MLDDAASFGTNLTRIRSALNLSNGICRSKHLSHRGFSCGTKLQDPGASSIPNGLRSQNQLGIAERKLAHYRPVQFKPVGQVQSWFSTLSREGADPFRKVNSSRIQRP